MRLRIKRAGWHLYLEIYRSVRFEGVNSLLANGDHFIMWDFDEQDVTEVASALRQVQKEFKLPTIYLVNTGKPKSWHGYCFKRVKYPLLLHILAATKGMDRMWFNIGVLRGFFTLRYTPRSGREFKPAYVLPGKVIEDVNPYELTNFSRYWSMRL